MAKSSGNELTLEACNDSERKDNAWLLVNFAPNYRLVGRRQLARRLGALRARPARQLRARPRRVVMDATNVHVRSEETLTTVIGVSDVIVVTTQDAVLVLHQEHGDKVKQLVQRL